MNVEKIGKFIAERRKLYNMTQQELADKLGVTDKAVSRWERGVGCPDISYLEDLSNILNTTIPELLKGEKIDNINNSDISNSINYSVNSIKNKYNFIINIIIIVIVSIISLLIIFYNIRNIYILNKEYTNNNDITKLDNYYNIILNNKGKYNDIDYSKIVKHINNLKEMDNIYNMHLKDHYKLKDLVFFIDNNIINQDIYPILLQYDNNKKDNMYTYKMQKIYYQSIISNVSNILEESLNYHFKGDNEMLNYFPIVISNFYKNEEMLLKDICEVGDLYE